MSVEYTYNNVDPFDGVIFILELDASSLPAMESYCLDGTTLKVFFASALTTAEETELDALVSNHPDLKIGLKEYLANYRWEKETGGILWNGVPVRTDDRSKMLLASIQKEIEDLDDPLHTRQVKTVAGFILMTDVQLAALYVDVIGHVQKCFDCEEETLALINDSTLTTEAAVATEFETRYAGV